MNLHPTMAQALKPWMPPVNDDPREQLLLEEDDSETTIEMGYCPDCSGSGEGSYDGSSCRSCGGSGETWVEVSK